MITDSWADNNEAKALYGVELVPIESIKEIDVALLAVGHDEYKAISVKRWQRIIKVDGYIYDVKSIYERGLFDDSSITHWRL